MKKNVSRFLAVVLVFTMAMGFASCGGSSCGGTPEPEKFTISVENGTGSGTYEKGKEITVEAIVPAGKEFSAWQSGGVTVSTFNPYTFTVTENLTLTAVFKDKESETFTITVENGTGGGTYEKGKEITVEATVPEGKEFSAWQSGGVTVSTSNPYTFTVTESLTLTAVFKDKDLEDLEDVVYYTVVVDGGIIVEEEAASASVEKGDEVTIRAVVPEFYEFERWMSNDVKVSDTPEFKHTVTGNVKFSSVIKAVSRYSLTLEGCTAESKYEAGVETVTVTANTPANYKFVNWTINDVPVSAPSVYEFELNEDTTVKANFKRINIHVDASADNELVQVTVTSDNDDPDAEVYEEGDSITVEARARNGISVIAWRDEEGTLLSRSNPYTFVATDDVTLIAEIGNVYTVELEGATFVDSELTQDVFGENGDCGVEALLEENEKFVNWTDGEGNIVSTVNPYIFKVKGNIKLKANVAVVEGKTYIFEGENADLSQNINMDGNPGNIEKHMDDDHGDPVLNAVNKCSNGYVVSCFNHNVGNKVIWRINSDKAAKATLIIRMGNGSWISATQTRDIPLGPEFVAFHVNGDAIDYTPFVLEGREALEGSSNLSVYGFAADYTIAMGVDLKEGPNVIDMELLVVDHGPNIDALKLTTTANLTWVPTGKWGAPIAEYDWNVRDKFTVTVENGTGGGLYEQGSKATVEAQVPADQDFEAWRENGTIVSRENPYTFTVSRNITLTATFKEKDTEVGEKKLFVFEGENADISILDENGNPGGCESDANDNHGGESFDANRCSNGYLVAALNHRVGNKVVWRIKSDKAAKAELILRGCSGVYVSATETAEVKAAPEGLSFRINGVELMYEQFVFPGKKAATGASDWSVYHLVEDYVISTSVDLKAGWNEITLELKKKGYGPQIDALKLKTTANLSWVPTQFRNNNVPIAEYDYNINSPETYDITVVGGTGTSSYTEGRPVTIRASIPAGKKFVCWKEGEEVVSTQDVYSFIAEKTVTLTAEFEDADVIEGGKEYVFEAENADLSGIKNQNGGPANVEFDIKNGEEFVVEESKRLSNGAVVTCYNHKVGNTIVWRIKSDSDAVAKLVFRLGGVNDGGSGTKDTTFTSEKLALFANGSELAYTDAHAEAISSPTGNDDWTAGKVVNDYEFLANISLKEGWNEISLVLNDTNFGPQIDAMKLTTTADLAWTPVSNNGVNIADYGYNITE